MLRKALNKDKTLQAYVIGLALGDGNLSNPNGRSTRLRIICDTKYPGLIEKIAASLKALLPDNKVSIVKRKGNCLDVGVYSNSLETLLGGSAKRGSKFVQQVDIPKWVFDKLEYQIACLQGLLETDGTIYSDRGYKAIMFTSIIKPLADSTNRIFSNLGFRTRLYTIQQRGKQYNYQTRYNIRLARDVQKFLDLTQFAKY